MWIFTRPGSGEVELVIDDEFGGQLAIQKETVASGALRLGKIIGKPVSLQTNLASVKQARDIIMPPWSPPPPKTLVLTPVRIVVSESGEVRVYAQDTERKMESLDHNFTGELSGHFRDYIVDLYLEDDAELGRFARSSQTLRSLVPSIASHIDDTPYDSL